jgi:hypothetical protein
MSQTTDDLKDDLKKGLSVLQTLRDEVRVKLHLAGMNAKDQWKSLEPHLAEIEQAAGDISESSRAAVTDAVNKLKTFRDTLGKE